MVILLLCLDPRTLKSASGYNTTFHRTCLIRVDYLAENLSHTHIEYHQGGGGKLIPQIIIIAHVPLPLRMDHASIHYLTTVYDNTKNGPCFDAYIT